MEKPKRAWLDWLDGRHRQALTDWTTSRNETERVRLEMGDNFTGENVDRLIRNHLAEAQALDRYRDAERDFVSFMKYMRENNLL